jgi:hypothetical protein
MAVVHNKVGTAHPERREDKKAKIESLKVYKTD